jgi:hypothetical protein
MGLFDFTPDAPDPRNYGSEMRQILRAQTQLAPYLYSAESAFSPLYAQSSVANLNTALLGSQGGPQDISYLGFRRQGGQLVPEERSLTVNTAASPGLLRIYQDSILPAMQRARDSERLGDIQAVEQYGQRATDAFRNANPQQAALLNTLSEQALGDLQLGSRLNDSEMQQVQQSARAAQQARGFGFSPKDSFEEVLRSAEFGNQLQQQRRGFASGVVGLNAATTTDPFLAVLGRPSQNVPAGMGLAGQAGAAGQTGPRLFNPESGYGSDVFNTNYNAEAASKISAANNNAGVIGGALSY